MKLKIFVTLFLIAIIGSIASAVEQGRKSKAIGGGGYFTEQELSILPDIIELRTRYYLFDRTKNLEKMMAPYIKKYGYGYKTIHHYGVGQIYLNRVNFDPSLDSQKKTFLLKRAISEFGFVMDPKKYPKYSELFKQVFLTVVLLKRAEAYLLLDQITPAIEDLFMIIKIKPSYYNAYIMLSKCYQSIGDSANAAKMLQIGERYKKGNHQN